MMLNEFLFLVWPLTYNTPIFFLKRESILEHKFNFVKDGTDFKNLKNTVWQNALSIIYLYKYY